MHCEDLTGNKYGRLTVIRRAGSNKHKKALWLCRCDCGNTKILTTGELKSKNTLSCGCLKREMLVERNYHHGGAGTKEYDIWKSMNQRCHNPKNKAYSDYGGRGITVCEQWRGEHGFENFLADMGERPSKDHSIDRIDNNKGYSPDNCRWATSSEQARNKRTTIKVEVEGELCSLPEACERKGIPQSRVRSRVDKGMNPQEAIEELDMTKTIYLEIDGVVDSFSGHAIRNGIKVSTAFNRVNKLGWSYKDAVTIKENPRVHYATINGIRKTVAECCEETGVPITAALARIKKGMTPEEAVTKPVKKLQELTYKGITKPLIEWAKDYNMRPETLRSRLYKLGWPIEKALNEPVKKKS